MGLCMSYDKLEKIDVSLAERIIATEGPHRTPVYSTIQENIIIHGAMNNFGHEKNTQSGKKRSHDTVLILFQNSNGTSQDSYLIISRTSDNITPKRRSLEHILNCQKLVRWGRLTERGRINDTFQPSQRIDHTATITSASLPYKKWVLARHLNRCLSQSDHENKLIMSPSFIATNSLLCIDSKSVTRMAFTSIIPYHIIYTAMVNFQNVLSQKKRKYGPLWSDEVVYRIAKEIQLQQPEKFDNIFLGISYPLLWKVSGRNWKERNVINFCSMSVFAIACIYWK